MADALRHGACLCGGVRLTIPLSRNKVGVCHCDTCRHWCSGPWMAIQAPEVCFTGDSLVIFRSSKFAERGFCSQCGCAIFHRPQDGSERAVSAGLFDPDGLELSFQICTDHKPEFYSIDPQTETRTSGQLAIAWGPKLLFRRLKRLLRKEPA